MEAVIHFLQCCVFDVFLSARFQQLFEIFGALRLHFGFHFDSFLRAPGLGKNSSKCVSVINFEGLAPPDGAFLEVLSAGAFGGWCFGGFL